MGWRLIILALVAVIIATTAVVVGQRGPPTQPQASQDSPAPFPSSSRGAPDQAVAGASGRPAREARPSNVESGADEPVLREEGRAAYYADKYQGRTTASGQEFNQNDLSAASRTLPLGARAKVVHRENGKSVDVTINDHGPNVDGRIIDLSKRAAEQLDMIEEGVAPVHVEARPSYQPTPELAGKVLREAEAQVQKER
jgi:rare lipoprotein A (peptidoglycan hydrolase)